MRTDWGIYEDPGRGTAGSGSGGIYSVSDVAGVSVYNDELDDLDDTRDDERSHDRKVYGFSSNATPRQWSSTHSVGGASASPARSVHSVSNTPAGGHRSSLGDTRRPSHSHGSYSDSLKRHDYSNPRHTRASLSDDLYRSVDKRSSERLNTSNSSSSSNRAPQQQGRSYSGTSRSDYSSPSAGYRSLRSYPSAPENYDDREPRSLDNSRLSNGYSSSSSSRYPDYSSRGYQGSLRRSSAGSKEYRTPSDVYTSRRSYPSESYPSRTAATRGILTNSSKYINSSRSSLSGGNNYNSGSRNNLSGYNDPNPARNDLSAPPSNTYEKRGSLSYSSRSGVNTSTRASQTELSGDFHQSNDGKTKSSLQVPEGVSSSSSRRSSGSIQQVTFSTGGGGSDSSQQGGGKEDKHDSTSRRKTSSLRKERDKSSNRKNTKDEQNQTEDDMSQWGGGGPSGGHWHQQGGYHGQVVDSPSDTSPHSHTHGPPLPRPPLPSQHYPDHDGQPQGHPPTHQQQHNHAYHHAHNHTHHTRQPSSSGSRQALVYTSPSEGEYV